MVDIVTVFSSNFRGMKPIICQQDDNPQMFLLQSKVSKAFE